VYPQGEAHGVNTKYSNNGNHGATIWLSYIITFRYVLSALKIFSGQNLEEMLNAPSGNSPGGGLLEVCLNMSQKNITYFY
jgi:hypothetical protein